MNPLQAQFGTIDIYLFDQLLRGRITPGMTIFDAGFGGGRNLVYFLNEGYTVFGCDPDARAFQALQGRGDFRQEPVESNSFPDAAADVVVCSAVLHFARDDRHFRAMLAGAWRVLKPGGLFFCRLASTIGMESLVKPLGERRYWLPDGSERYLVDEALLMQITDEIGGALLDPIKTTVVQNQRAMTTWVMRKQ